MTKRRANVFLEDVAVAMAFVAVLICGLLFLSQGIG